MYPSLYNVATTSTQPPISTLPEFQAARSLAQRSLSLFQVTPHCVLTTRDALSKTEDAIRRFLDLGKRAQQMGDTTGAALVHSTVESLMGRMQTFQNRLSAEVAEEELQKKRASESSAPPPERTGPRASGPKKRSRGGTSQRVGSKPSARTGAATASPGRDRLEPYPPKRSSGGASSTTSSSSRGRKRRPRPRKSPRGSSSESHSSSSSSPKKSRDYERPWARSSSSSSTPSSTSASREASASASRDRHRASRKRKRGRGAGSSGRQSRQRRERPQPHPQSPFCRACLSGDDQTALRLFSSSSFRVEEADHLFGPHFCAFGGHLELLKELIFSGRWNFEEIYYGGDQTSGSGFSIEQYCKNRVVKYAVRVFRMLAEEFSRFIGLAEVKNLLLLMARKIILDKKREISFSTPSTQSCYDMVLTGNPGTGKTSIARLIARMLHVFGILATGSFVEVQRSGLVGSHIGETALKTKKTIEGAAGGVMFVDEAYRLSAGGQKDFGKEAIEEIMQHMNAESSEESVVFIFAGYKQEMADYIRVNPGLFRRVSYTIEFPDYSVAEIAEIFELLVRSSEYVLARDVSSELLQRILQSSTSPTIRAKMNGGLAKKLMQYSIDEMNLRIKMDATGDELRTIHARDVLSACRKRFSA